jgi:hypothetical protein
MKIPYGIDETIEITIDDVDSLRQMRRDFFNDEFGKLKDLYEMTEDLRPHQDIMEIFRSATSTENANNEKDEEQIKAIKAVKAYTKLLNLLEKQEERILAIYQEDMKVGDQINKAFMDSVGFRSETLTRELCNTNTDRANDEAMAEEQ